MFGLMQRCLFASELLHNEEDGAYSRPGGDSVLTTHALSTVMRTLGFTYFCNHSFLDP
jgi:hypothetical protein